MKYLVKNWDHFQHYRDRNPPWIKLHFDLLSSADWVSLDDTSRVLAIACMLIASRSKGEKGEIDGSESGLAYLKRVAYLNKPPNLKPLILSGFLIPASSCKQVLADASSSVSVSSLYASGDKGCGEKGKKPKSKTSIPPDFAISPNVAAWAKEKGFDRLDLHLEHFKDTAMAKGYTYVDWDAAFKNAVRGNWANLEATVPDAPGEFDHLPRIDYPCWICGCRIDPPETCRLKWHGMTAEQYARGDWERPQGAHHAGQ